MSNAAMAAAGIEEDHRPAVITVNGLSKTYLIYDKPYHRLLQSVVRSRKHYFREHRALLPLSFSVAPGETLGIVGTNGSGKSTLLQLICGTLSPSSGSVEKYGRLSALLELGAGFNPEFSGHENIYLNASILGMSDAEIAEKYESIVAFSGLDADLLRRPVSTYSSGMYVRLAFAVAISIEPEILIVDEALAVGDEAFQRKCFARISQLQERGTAILFVSHASNTIINLCSRALWLDQGQLLMDGSPKEVIAQYHQFIYAAPEEQLGLKSALLSGKVAEARPQTNDDLAISKRAESCVEYTSKGGRILHPRLFDADGHVVHQVTTGDQCYLRYEFACEEDMSHVRFAMFLKTKLGAELAGSLIRSQDDDYILTQRGKSYIITFSFRCNLLEGIYYVNCGASYFADGNDHFIHRLVDVLEFRVLPHGDKHSPVEARGMVDLGITGEVTSAG